MKIYIEAYYADDTPALGSMDGQGVLYAKQYKRTLHYKELKITKVKKTIAYWLIRDATSRKVLEKIPHIGFKPVEVKPDHLKALKELFGESHV